MAFAQRRWVKRCGCDGGSRSPSSPMPASPMPNERSGRAALVAIETRAGADLVLGPTASSRGTGGVLPGTSVSRAAVGAAHARSVPGRPPSRGPGRLHRSSRPVSRRARYKTRSRPPRPTGPSPGPGPRAHSARSGRTAHAPRRRRAGGDREPASAAEQASSAAKPSWNSCRGGPAPPARDAGRPWGGGQDPFGDGGGLRASVTSAGRRLAGRVGWRGRTRGGCARRGRRARGECVDRPGDQAAASTVELIVRHLAGRSVVVVMDNCEHVIAQAAALADALIGSLPALRLIATSREPLGVPGEILVAVGGLAPPAAVELFVERARAVRPGFTADERTRLVIEDICRRLDGLPLAVELAAARLRALTLATVAQRLDDRFRLLTGGARTALPRQQSLRAVVDWSYDLLFDDERVLFNRLAVFSGGCELTAAEAVCADDQVPAGEILDVVSRLVDKSLVTAADAAGETRFTQHQTLWQYGRERLDESGEVNAMRARHARVLPADGGGGPRGSARRHRADVARQSQLRRWATCGPRSTGSSPPAMLMRRWRWRRGWPGCGGSTPTSRKERAGSVTPSATNGPRRGELAATAHSWHGYCVGMSSSPAAGAIECEQAVADLRASDDRGGLANGAGAVCAVLVRAHEFERSLELLAEAHDLLEAAGHGWLLAAHDLILAWNLASLGRLEDAESAARSSVKRFDAEGEVLLVVSPLNSLAGIAAARGDLGAASVGLRSAPGAMPRYRAAPLTSRSAFSLSPGYGPGKATTPSPTACTTRRSHAASTRGCPPTRWSVRQRSPVASAT